MLLLEDQACFNFTYYMYIISVIIFIMIFLLFLVNCCICLAFREIGTEEENMYDQYDSKPNDDKPDAYAFDDREVVPTF